MSDAAPFHLQDLQADLRAQLQGAYFPTDPVQVRCVLKENIFLVLVQHSAPALTVTRAVFRLIRDRLYQEAIAQHYRVVMYLRVTGANEPYAFHVLQETTSVTTPELATKTDAVADAFTEAVHLEATDEPFPPVGNELEDPFGNDDQAADLVTEADTFEGFTTADGTLGAFTDSASTTGDRPKGRGLFWVGAGLVAVLAAYGLSRPCVVGRCERLEIAAQLADPAQSQFAAGESPSGQDIFQAQADLQGAIATLETIPSWSPQRAAAQAQLADYQDLNESLSTLINGLSQAAKAAQMAENASLTPAQWQEIATQWQGAIATLDTIPPEDFYYDFAQEKLSNYRRNLTLVEQRLQESQAQTTDATGN
ncbi:hypothetical protein FLX56_25420 [Synechococcus moorigangaii CMS01]|nr:hypothetical protein [Synechococcus moorigangaii CMS01]